MTAARDVVDFWQKAGREKWFAKDDAFDAAIRENFLDLHFKAARNEVSDWMETAEGALALMILLDQFPRNLFRNSGHAFATDPLALSLAKKSIELGHDTATEPDLAGFFYLPFEHAEDLAEQERCIALFTALTDRGGPKDYLDYAVIHRDVIVRFGRFPHRNPALGRTTTADEQVFLNEGGFKG
ncbi:DUF924 family protein [Peteryoungia ipomoeae]|uniref:DUF924 domain-containing protein n=1 Tax=Peteryoungia ipomoeae TaxID=1210932 RepID=A0A4S8NXS6_9HYPH|nr:DUF924 family protein [Peteryoungia ipomoeae]THV22513.1 DUF924 domain-containing protein [Peteryoungia ipomoeae]